MIEMKERFEKSIERLDNYLRLTRFKYTDLEKLSRLKILDDFYESKKEKADTEKLSFNIECAEELKKGELTLPLKVRGIFLTEGRPQLKYYTAEELQKSIENPLNAKFPLMLDHKDNEAGKIIGAVDKISYDDSIKGIRWWGHINDETFARNVIDSVINQVSATIYSASEQTLTNGLVGKDLTFKELSLVLEGAEPHNSIEVDTDGD